MTGNVRVRHHGDRTRIEVDPTWVPWLAERFRPIAARLEALGVPAAELDPQGYRRGSLLLEASGGR